MASNPPAGGSPTLAEHEGEAYAGALAAAGVPVAHHRFPGLIHGFINMTNVNPASRDATIALAGMLRARCHRAEHTPRLRAAGVGDQTRRR